MQATIATNGQRRTFEHGDRSRLPLAHRVARMLATLEAEGRDCGVAVLESHAFAGAKLVLPAEDVEPWQVGRVLAIATREG